MATKTSQRIGIWVIAIAMLVGTVGTFGALILQNENASQDAVEYQKFLEEYEQQMKQQEEQAKQNAAISLPLEGYEAEKFAADKVTQLTTKDLKSGTGKTATAKDKLTVSYFGWTPDGKIFDSSRKKGAESQPFVFTPADGGAIEGWVEGLPGMKVGGVRKLVIPAEQAYGASGSGIIKPNTPLTFIVRLDKIGG